MCQGLETRDIKGGCCLKFRFISLISVLLISGDPKRYIIPVIHTKETAHLPPQLTGKGLGHCPAATFEA